MSVASLLRPTVPDIDVAPFSVVTPETVRVLAAKIAPLMVMMSVPTDPSVTSPLKESEPAIATFAAAVMSPLTVMTSANSSHSLTASVKSAARSGSSTDGER